MDSPFSLRAGDVFSNSVSKINSILSFYCVFIKSLYVIDDYFPFFRNDKFYKKNNLVRVPLSGVNHIKSIQNFFILIEVFTENSRYFTSF